MEQYSYSWLKSQKEQLIQIINQQIAVNNQINFSDTQTNQLKDLLNRLISENFKVLVMGTFSSGKSTFINAFLGKKILPAKMLPSTATICEIKFANEIKCTLYPKNNRYFDKKTGKIINTPFDININELKNYIVINHDDLNETNNTDEKDKSSPFEKMLLEWPLGICKNGVEVIDSPGLNDPNSHDKITLEYLPHTDAIIYCMSCAQAFSQIDKTTITDLRSLGYKSIIFILTNFDRIQGTDEEEEFKKSTIANLSKYTDLEASGVLFVNSLGGVNGKEENDIEKINNSNILIVEQKVENHLVEQKGKAKLIIGESQIRSQNQITARFISDKLKLNSLNIDEQKKKYEQLSLILNSAKNKRDLILKTLELGIIDILNQTDNIGRIYLRSLEGKIGDWVNNYTPENNVSILPPWGLKASVKRNIEEYIDYIKMKLKKDSILWGNEKLQPMITDSINKISLATSELQSSYEDLLRSYHVEMNFNNLAQTHDEVTASPISKFGSFLYGVVSGDYLGASIGYTFGFKGLITSLIAQISVGVILGIASLFTPVGLPAFIIGAIIAAITSGKISFDAIPKKIKNTIIEKFQDSLKDMSYQDEIINNIKTQISIELNKLVIEAKDLFEKDITPKETALKQALILKQKGEKEVQAENIVLFEAEKSNIEIQNQIEKFSMTINI